MYRCFFNSLSLWGVCLLCYVLLRSGGLIRGGLFRSSFFGTLLVKIPLLAAVAADRIFIKDRITVFVGANLFVL